MKLLISSTLLLLIACNSGKKIVAEANDCIDTTRTELKMCTEEYDPVCGCDGKTYGNECSAYNGKVLTWVPGECPPKDCIDTSNIKEQPCTKIYKPVCGCNNVTYSNECMAKNKGVKSWKQGKCP